MKNLLIVALVIAFTTASVSATTNLPQQEKKEMGCYVMKDGKMYHSVGEKETLMTKDVTLKNGTKIMTNGSWKEKGKSAKMLKNDECVDMMGKMHESHEAHKKV